MFPLQRLRRLRASAGLRSLIRETRLDAGDLIAPIFLCEGKGLRREVRSMPGVCQHSLDKAADEARALSEAGVPAVILFGVPAQARKNAGGSEAWNSRGLVQRAAGRIKKEVPGLVVIADACFCEYTTHGHCGVLDAQKCLDNDRTLENLARVAVSQARAGADIIAPSGMLDGMVRTVRAALDMHGFTQTAVLAYSAKYASAFYGPFRDAAGGAPAFGDRRQHQMDPANRLEAKREALLDVEEGADILMLKPALAYLDIIREVRNAVDLPLCAYNVSGEYSMVKAAARAGWLDERRAVLEITRGIKRAGADMIITYWARDLAHWLAKGIEAEG